MPKMKKENPDPVSDIDLDPDFAIDPAGKMLAVALDLRRIAYLMSEGQPFLAEPLLVMARAIEDCAYAPVATSGGGLWHGSQLRRAVMAGASLAAPSVGKGSQAPAAG